MALLVLLPKLNLAGQVLAARDARRFAIGICVAFLAWFVIWYSIIAIFLFNATATTEIYTLSLHDALPICRRRSRRCTRPHRATGSTDRPRAPTPDRKSTRLNSSHDQMSYAVFCLKKQ